MEVGYASGARSLETGCWVYLVLPGNSIGVRSLPSIEGVRTGVGFAPGELISVDLIQETEFTSSSSSGPFLKLSDHSGWLFERKQGVELMRRVPVTDGLWTFFAHNPPTGIALRSHPVDRSDVTIKKTITGSDSILFSPTQKICCDKKVTHPSTGVNYYRVQGTRGWVFDRRGDTRMLLDEDDVQMGLFAYKALESICIRAWATTEDRARMELSVKTHDIVVGDMILDGDSRNGPFIHLTGCGGWLFEKYANSKMFEPLPIDSGSWKLRVENSVGIGLRAQPIDEGSNKFSTIYNQNSIVSCDKRIRSPVSGVNFYRAAGTQGWVFDRRGDKVMMTLLSTDPMVSGFQDSLNGNGGGWSPDFVRGIASTVEGVEEISYSETSRVISFRSNSVGARINVYYTTRTVSTALDHPLQGKTQLFRRNCDPAELRVIFENPRIHTDKGYQRKRKSGEADSVGPTRSIPVGTDFVVDTEDELRHDLFDCEQELCQLKAKRSRLRDKVEQYSAEHQQAAEKISSETEKLRQQIEEKREAARKKEVTCPFCSREFANKNALQQHKRDRHGFKCEQCFRSFNDDHSLSQHKSALGHW